MIKKLFLILTLLILLNTAALAFTQEGSAEYNIYGYQFKQGDSVKFAEKADSYMQLWEKTQNNTEKDFYLQESMRYYFLLSQANKDSITAHIGLGKIYDEMKLDILAKEQFFIAYNMDCKNPELNMRFGDFYYKRQHLIMALPYYKTAYSNGYYNSAYLNNKIATIYEKLADLETAKRFYLVAHKLNPQNIKLIEKIQKLEKLNYSASQYYLIFK